MSLLSTQERWGVTCGHGEEFDKGSLATLGPTSQFDDSRTIVFSASTSGVVRAYNPEAKGYDENDLMVETDLNLPVLQIEIGKFDEFAKSSLVVLHPNMIAIFDFQHPGASGSPGHLKLQRQIMIEQTGRVLHIFSSTFELFLFFSSLLFQDFFFHVYLAMLTNTSILLRSLREAFSMVIGRFGDARFDKICVLSIDGELLFLDQDSCVFARQLDGFLLPAPLTYCQTSDLFFTCNSSFDLQCYNFQSFTVACQEENASPVEHRSALNWEVCIGEAALQILTVKVPSSMHSKATTTSSTEVSDVNSSIRILLLSSRSLFIISEDGCLMFHQRFNFTPVMCHALLPPTSGDEGSNLSILIVDSSDYMMIYRGMQMVWASKCERAPVALTTAPFRNVDGHVILLSKNGALCINNLGTVPADKIVGVSCENSVERIELEHGLDELAKLKRASSSEQKVDKRSHVKIDLQIGESAIVDHFSSNTDTASRKIELRLFVRSTGSESIENVTIFIRTPPPLICLRNCISVPLLHDGEDATIMIPIAICIPADSARIPSNRNAVVIVSYQTLSGEQYASCSELHLPFTFFCALATPEKNASHKVTLEMNYPPPRLGDLFEDILTTIPGEKHVLATSNVICFRHHNGDKVTVIVSKNAGKFRLQSTGFEPIWLILSEMVERLQSRYADGLLENSPMRLTLHGPLPLHDFLSSLDAQENVRCEYALLDSFLGCHARQLRAAQKRLLYRYNEKNPSCLSHLDEYVEKACLQVMTTASTIEIRHHALTNAGYSLAAATNYFLLLLQLRFHMNEAEISTIRGHVPIFVRSSEEQAWGTWTHAAVAMLLKSLGKSVSGNLSELQRLDRSQMSSAQNIFQLKRQIPILLERLRRNTDKD